MGHRKAHLGWGGLDALGYVFCMLKAIPWLLMELLNGFQMCV